MTENYPNIYFSYKNDVRSVHALVLEYAMMGDLQKWIKKKNAGIRENSARAIFRMLLSGII